MQVQKFSTHTSSLKNMKKPRQTIEIKGLLCGEYTITINSIGGEVISKYKTKILFELNFDSSKEAGYIFLNA